MAIVEKSALVPYSAAQMYRLVNEVDGYPAFLPWCKSGRSVSKTETEQIGEIVVSRSGITQAFSTRNQMIPNERIDLNLEEGPFRKLQGTWLFQELREDACKVSLTLEYEFSGRLINAAFGAVFSHIANTMVDAFCKQAGVIYSGK